jgi:hypothetical protein
MWTLEFHRIGGEWFVWLRGSLEGCLRDALALREGQHGWDGAYDAARLGFSHDDDEDAAWQTEERRMSTDPVRVMQRLAAALEGARATQEKDRRS